MEAKLAKAAIFIQQDDTTAALPVIDELIAAAPDNGRAWRLKGQALLRQQKFEDARSAFDQAIANSAAAFVFSDRTARALINVQLQDYEAAQAEVTELSSAIPLRTPPLITYRACSTFRIRSIAMQSRL